MENKNQLLIDEVNSNLAIYLGFILVGVLFALGNQFHFQRGNILLEVIFWVNLVAFLGLSYYLYGRTQALIMALRKNIPLEEAEAIVKGTAAAKYEAMNEKDKATSEEQARQVMKGDNAGAAVTGMSNFGYIWYVTVFAFKMIPLGFFFVYMIIITLIDYIKGNSSASGFIENFTNSLKKKVAVVVNKD